jgi:uncharacterized protein YecT (DUF1311 family)
MIIAALLSLTLQAAPSARAEPLFGPDPVQSPASRGAPQCVRDGNTLQLNACVLDDVGEEEARMQRYFDLAMTRAIEDDGESGQFGGSRTQQQAWLQASQYAWEAYAESRCAGVLDRWKDGTIRTMATVGCRIQAVRQRTHDIWTDHLTFPDSTPPLLPEPVKPVRAEQTNDGN